MATKKDKEIELEVENSNYFFPVDENNNDIAEGANDDEEDDGEIPEWNLINAFDQVLADSRFNEGTIETRKGKSALEYLMTRLEMTSMQVIVIAMLIDEGSAMSWGGMAKFLGISRLRMMTYTDEVEELVNKRRWLINSASREMGRLYEGFALTHGVIRALRHDTIFEPEKLDGMDTQCFVERLTSKVNSCLGSRSDDNLLDNEQWFMTLVNENPHLPLCHDIIQLNGDIHNKTLMLLLVADYANWAGQPNEGLTMNDIDSAFPEDWECEGMRRKLTNGTHELIRKGYVEFKCEDGMANGNHFVLTKKSKDELLSNFKPSAMLNIGRRHLSDRDLVRCKDIKEKTLYYNEREDSQMKRLAQILSEDQFPEIQKRLAAKGMRTGVAVLLSGGPGTGKTEGVKQLAKRTGRDLLMIDISQVKDKFVGESEKNTKAIFERYKRLCNDSKLKPILFINECDAILGKRSERAEQAADKMQNSMQNILLQALEDLDGIMICTTNLATSLDAAFERRFLMKVEFDKPGIEVRSNIWKSMIPSLTDEEAHHLAENYNFSGGQCENVMRKVAIEEIINGTSPSLNQIENFCKEESIVSKKTLRPITGFAA